MPEPQIPSAEVKALMRRARILEAMILDAPPGINQTYRAGHGRYGAATRVYKTRLAGAWEEAAMWPSGLVGSSRCRQGNTGSASTSPRTVINAVVVLEELGGARPTEVGRHLPRPPRKRAIVHLCLRVALPALSRHEAAELTGVYAALGYPPAAVQVAPGVAP